MCTLLYYILSLTNILYYPAIFIVLFQQYYGDNFVLPGVYSALRYKVNSILGRVSTVFIVSDSLSRGPGCELHSCRQLCSLCVATDHSRLNVLLLYWAQPTILHSEERGGDAIRTSDNLVAILKLWYFRSPLIATVSPPLVISAWMNTSQRRWECVWMNRSARRGVQSAMIRPKDWILH